MDNRLIAYMAILKQSEKEGSVSLPKWCACPQPSAPEPSDMTVYVCQKCGGVAVVNAEDEVLEQEDEA